MPDELTQEQVETLVARLEAKRDEIAALRALNEGETRPVDLDLPIGRLTRIDAIQQQQMAKAGRRSLGVRLRQVEAALAAAARGEYGACRECGEPIGWTRLSARPESARCLDCQGEAEGRR